MATRKKTAKKRGRSGRECQRYWLMVPQKLVRKPVVYELGHKFDVVTNVRQATIHEDVGLVSLEIEGARDEIKKAVKWLEKRGVKVEPVEVNVLEG
jgi:ABC-type methionine transport system ATPase subunit